jgi:hypothetical protein
VEDDLVVQRPSKKRMRMANHSGVRRVCRAGVEQGFEATSGTFEEAGVDGLVRRNHISRLHKVGVGLRTSRPPEMNCEPGLRSEIPGGRGLSSDLLFS